jgi:NAD(P)-dependent dehydrogenase (short-subunit alcohol dehydrogenase family)
MSTIMITGSAAGLGNAIATALTRAGHTVIDFDKKLGNDVCKPATTWGAAPPPGLDVLINCAGVNKINWLQNVTEDDWDAVMDTNAKGIFKMTQWALPELIKNQGTVINIVSNAAHMPMRCSLAYNASKGAALIMTKQLARELTSQGITVFSVSPNKLRGTEMSDDIDRQVVATRGWSIEEAQKYQLAGLLNGEETDPVQLAAFVAYLLQDKAHHKALSGCDIPYGQ